MAPTAVLRDVAHTTLRSAIAAAAPLLARESVAHLERRGLTVTDTQKVTLGVIAAYVVGIALLWNIPYVRNVLWPFKVRLPGPPDPWVPRADSGPARPQMLVIAFHEFGHAITCLLTGGRVVSITLNPNEGGETQMKGGRQALTLPAGYLGSSIIGALLTFCGFDIIASKVASFVLGICFLLTLWWGKKDWLTILTIALAVGLLVACWFIAHAQPLRFVVVSTSSDNPLLDAEVNANDGMVALYWRHVISVQRLGYCESPRPSPTASEKLTLPSQCDDLILRKVNSSDASVFARRYGGSSQCWGVIWSIISILFMTAGIVAGIAAFPRSFQEQEDESKKFIPT